MVYWTILFYQVYRNHAKSNGIKPLFFFEAKGLLSQPLGSFETLGSKLSHGTSLKFADVRTHLRKVFKVIL